MIIPAETQKLEMIRRGLLANLLINKAPAKVAPILITRVNSGSTGSLMFRVQMSGLLSDNNHFDHL